MARLLLWASGAMLSATPVYSMDNQPNAFVARDVSVPSFDQVEVIGPLKVSVMVGAEPAKVHLIGPPALIADTIAAVDGGKLTIRFRDGAAWSWNPGSGVNAVVSAPRLRSARVQGAAQLEIDQAGGDTFAAATDGSGSIVLWGLKAGRLILATGGAGSITAEGTAREGTYAVGGSGSIDAKRLKLQTAQLALGGAGSIYADVAQTANVSAGGSGRVEVVGGATCVKSQGSSQHIECR